MVKDLIKPKLLNEIIGLILCADKNGEHIELLRLEESNIKVAQYLTQLPDLKLLEQKLRQSVEISKNRILREGADNA